MSIASWLEVMLHISSFLDPGQRSCSWHSDCCQLLCPREWPLSSQCFSSEWMHIIFSHVSLAKISYINISNFKEVGKCPRGEPKNYCICNSYFPACPLLHKHWIHSPSSMPNTLIKGDHSKDPPVPTFICFRAWLKNIPTLIRTWLSKCLPSSVSALLRTNDCYFFSNPPFLKGSIYCSYWIAMLSLYTAWWST